ncbi:Formate hydrogenlyase subunit 2 [Cronobacter muytjensii 530]
MRAVAVKCDLCQFDDEGPACVRTCPTRALKLVDNHDIARASRRKRELTINAEPGDLSLLMSPRGGEQ